MNDIETVRSARRATTLVSHPIRTRILRHAREPISGSDLARHLGQPRQRVSYHVRQLAQAGFLVPVGQRKKRNMVEQQYVATARAYVLTPEVLGEVAPDPAETHDSASAAHLVALCARAQSDVAGVMEAASEARLRVRTISLQSDIGFKSVEERAAFTAALQAAINAVIAQHSTPTGSRPFRLIVGCYPLMQEPAASAPSTV